MAKRAKGDPAQQTTIGGRRPARSRAGKPRRCVGLTIAHHSDLSRIGERVLVDVGESVELSRLEPLFSVPHGEEALPLEDPHVSRKPLVIHTSATGVRIERGTHSGNVSVDGNPFGETASFGLDALKHGVTLQLGHHVLLLLHEHLIPARAATDADELIASSLIGASAGLDRVRARIGRVSAHDIPVLLRGESGTGKELVAAAIHELGPRADAPFVSVNLAAVPSSTAAAALFGHVKGAFTGASQASEGYFAAAQGGTLFLDEVAEAPEEVQTALLRALETGEVQPVGASQPRKVDVRLVAATDADLEGRMDEGKFRLPLMMRLSGYELRLPALRERRDDIPRLLFHFVREELARLGREAVLEDDDPPWLPVEVTRACLDHPWVGNVRELRNLARQIVIDWADADEVGLEAVANLERSTPAAEPAPKRADTDEKKGVDELDEEEVIAALAAHGYRPGPTAKALGVARSTLYVFIDKSDKIRKASDLTEDEISKALDDHDDDHAAAAESLTVSTRGLRLRMKALGMT
jgi:two-component system nitrogen regulation response regulator GlnG